MTRISRFIALAAVAPVFAMSACSSSDDNGGSGSGDAEAVAAAKTDVEAASTPHTTIPITQPLSGSVEGKVIAYAEPSIPVGKIIGSRLEAAAEALGMTVKRVNIGVSPDTVAAGMDEVVRMKPDAVVAVAFDPQTFWSKQAKALADAEIPTVGIGYISCDTVLTPCKDDEIGSSLALVATPDSTSFADLEAAKVIADSDGKANAVYFGDPQLGNGPILQKAFIERMESCGGCTVDSVDLAAADIGTNVPSQIVSYLQAHPKVKYVSVQYGDFAIGLPQALKAAGLNDVKVVTQGSASAQFDDIKAGGAQIADVPVAFGYMGYVATDSVARLLLGDKIEADQVLQPLLLMTKDNLDVSDDGYWPGVKDYRAQFEKLWSQTP